MSFFLLKLNMSHDRAGRGIERALADTLTVQPVVLDELRNRGLRDERVADKVLLGEGRDHQEGLTRTRTAATGDRQAIDTGRLGSASGAAETRTVQSVEDENDGLVV